MKAPIKDFNIQLYKDGSVTQYFAENPALYSSLNIGLKGHNGIDIVAPHGTPMYAVEAGTVVEVKRAEDGYGRHLRFITRSIDGSCNEWTYGHCDTIHVNVGDKIQEGQLIATMGNTGFVVSGATPYWKVNPFAGTHLHLGLRKVRRSATGWSYPNSDIKIKVLNYNNGYLGAIDPRPLLETVSDDTAEQERLLTIISLLTKVLELYKQLALVK